MADGYGVGDFQEFSSLLKARPGGSFGQKFHYRHKLGGDRQRGRGRGFFNRQHDQGRRFHSNYVGHKEKFSQTGRNNDYWVPSNVEEASIQIDNFDPQHRYNSEGNAHLQNPQFSNERIYGRGHGRGRGRGRHNLQSFNNRFHDHGHWKSNGNHIHGENLYHHGVSGYEDYEDTESSQCFGNDSRERPTYRGNQGKCKFFVHSHGKMVGRGGTFRGSFKRMGTNFGNKALSQILNSKKGTSNTPLPINLHVNMHDEIKDDGIEAKVCSIGSLPAPKIDGFAPSTKKKVRKIKAASLIQSLLDAKCVSQSPAPIKGEPGKEGSLCQAGDVAVNDDQKPQEINLESEGTHPREEAANIKDKKCQEGELKKEGTFLQEGNVTAFVDQRHRERAFISCIGGTKKRPRSAAVRDFPEGCGSLRLSVAKKIKFTSSESKAAATDPVVANSIGEIAPLPKLEARNENYNDLSISDVHVELVQADPKHSFEDCNRRHVTERDGFAELIQLSGKIFDEKVILTSCKGDTLAELVQASPEAAINSSSCEVDTLAELVQVSPEAGNKSNTVLSKENAHTDLVQVGLEVNCDNCCKPVVAEKNDLLEPVQIVPESNIGDYIKTGEIDKNHSPELVQLNLQVSIKECNATIKTAGHISCNGHDVSSHFAVETSQVKMPPQVNAIATLMPMHTSSSMHVHTSSEGISHSVAEKKRRNTSMNQKAETKVSDGALKKTLRQSKLDKLARELTADISTGLHNQGDMSTELKVLDISEITEISGALVPYQNSNGGSMKNKECGRRLIRKGSNRAKHFQTSKSLDSLMHIDPAIGLSLEATEGPSSRLLVKRTLQEYEYIRKALVKSKDPVRRPDLDAGSLLKERGKWRNCGEKIVGEVPGVEVGDQFSFRMEMLIIGLHRQVQSGIDYILGTKRDNGAPLAISIVSSGGYENDEDDGNTLIYSGHGGNNSKGNKKQESNQELVRGNLALSNSMKEGTPVRVIRGITDHTSPSSKIYTYDGLYDVIDCRFDCGATGFGVYHFTLTRRAGQPQVGLSLLSNLKKKGLARPYLLLDDISRGQERLPVCVVNEVDEETAPLNFTYIPKIKHPVWYTPLVPQGCSCVGVCDEETCSCAVKNGDELPYNEKGYLVRDKDVVYECGISCSCSSSCENRVSQKGLRYRLEVFKTNNRGWGVRSLDPIQPGGFICEYSGELLTDAEAEQRVGNDEYLFDLGNGCKSSCDQHNLAETDESAALVLATEEVAYTIDAKDLGNVARFINHSCSPNLYAQNVLYDSDDLRFPHVMLFAMENIPPLREFTYDYNYRLDQVRDADGKVKTKACHCGAQDCQGRLY